MTLMPAVHCIVPAAGSGARLGHAGPKALVEVAGRALFLWTIEALVRTFSFRSIVVLAPPGREEELRRALVGQHIDVIVGGATRSASVRCGMKAVRQRGAQDGDIVLIHDAARPLVSGAAVERCITAALEHGAATTCVPSVDTLCEVRQGKITSFLDRSQVYQVQTPQCARLDLLERAHAGEPEGSDEASLLSRVNDVAVVAGDRAMWKVTFPEDLLLLEQALCALKVAQPE